MKKLLLASLLIVGSIASAQNISVGASSTVSINNSKSSEVTDNLGLGEATGHATNFLDKTLDRFQLAETNRLWRVRATLLAKAQINGRMKRNYIKRIAGVNVKLGLEWNDYTTKRSDLVNPTKLNDPTINSLRPLNQ